MKRKRPFTISFEPGQELATRLQYETDASGMPKSEIIRRALTIYLSVLEKKRKEKESDKSQLKIWDHFDT